MRRALYSWIEFAKWRLGSSRDLLHPSDGTVEVAGDPADCTVLPNTPSTTACNSDDEEDGSVSEPANCLSEPHADFWSEHSQSTAMSGGSAYSYDEEQLGVETEWCMPACFGDDGYAESSGESHDHEAGWGSAEDAFPAASFQNEEVAREVAQQRSMLREKWAARIHYDAELRTQEAGYWADGPCAWEDESSLGSGTEEDVADLSAYAYSSRSEELSTAVDHSLQTLASLRAAVNAAEAKAAAAAHRMQVDELVRLHKSPPPKGAGRFAEFLAEKASYEYSPPISPTSPLEQAGDLV